MSGRKRSVNTNLLDGVTADMLGGADFQILDDGGMRVERILLEMVRPDPVQPRRVLPERVYHAFHNNRLTPTQALRELIQTAQIAAKQNGRPFTNVLEMLDDPDEETAAEAVVLSPEEVLVRDLVDLALTIQGDGQVNPLTVVDVTQGVTRLYRIETGERRYWASWLLRDFMPGYESDGLVPCVVIPAEKASPFRQAKENTVRAGLSAIAMARQAGLLLLTVHGCPMPEGAVENDFYRQALDLDLRGHREYSTEILSAMGGISRMHFSRFKALLHLSDEAIEIADRYHVEERKLRPLLTVDAQYHAEIARQIVDFNLTSRQIEEICKGDPVDEDTNDPIDKISASATKIARVSQSVSKTSPQEIARALLQQEGDIGLARARLQSLTKVLGEVAQYLAS